MFLKSSHFLVLIGSCFSFSIYANTPHHQLPLTCTKKCETALSTKLGGTNSVIGYSNCTSECKTDEWNSVTLSNGQVVKTGMKWQCVEYARRWFILRLGYTFESIDHAYQIWDLQTASSIDSSKKKNWVKCRNGKTSSKPQPHDLLIYNQQQGPDGHVSVIVAVKNNFVFIAEQNYSNEKWKQTNFARKIKLDTNAQGHYALKDKGVIGWMRLSTR
jgi:hypothetical protein